jgi:hypothetical protein
MPRRPSTAQAAARPHARAKADKRVGQAATSGDPWAERIRAAIFEAYHPWQKQAANDPSRFWTVLTGRGAGKTTLFKGRYLTEMAATPKGKYIYACPTLGMAVELLWEPLKETCSQLGLEFGKDVHFFEAPREGGKIMVLDRTGSRLKLFGADDQKQINLCRGQPFDGVGGDEMVYWNIDLVDNFVRKVIGPRIGERNGWIGLASSPGHVLRGFFYDRTRDGSTLHRPYDKRDEPEYEDWKGWSSHRWNLADVVALPTAEVDYPALCALRRSHLEMKAMERYSDDNPVWMREYEGRWAADDTTMVFRFDPEKNLWRPQGDRQLDGLLLLKAAIAALPKGFEWHYVLGGDKGKSRVDKEGEHKTRTGDPYAINVFAFSPADPERRLMHVYCMEKRGLYARPIAQLLLGPDESSPTGCKPHDKPGGILGLIGWPDGMVFDADDGLTMELANVYGLRVERTEKKPDYKMGVVELTNGDLVDGRIKVIEDTELHRQITSLQWAEQSSGALREDPSQANHSTDCLIYARTLIAKLFESGVVTQEATGKSVDTSYHDPMGLGSDEDDADIARLLADPVFGDGDGWSPA